MKNLKKSSSPEPLGHFQPNLAQIIFGWREFKFFQMKGPFFFPRGDNCEIKNIDKFKKSSSQEQLGQFQLNLEQIILEWSFLSFLNEGPLFSKGT